MVDWVMRAVSSAVSEAGRLAVTLLLNRAFAIASPKAPPDG